MESICSPCEHTISQIDMAREATPWALECEIARSRKYMRNKLKLWEVPLPGIPDEIEPAKLQEIVFHFARTGELNATARRSRMQSAPVYMALRREAAVEMIESMVEEGTWPEGAPTAL